MLPLRLSLLVGLWWLYMLIRNSKGRSSRRQAIMPSGSILLLQVGRVVVVYCYEFTLGYLQSGAIPPLPSHLLIPTYPHTRVPFM